MRNRLRELTSRLTGTKKHPDPASDEAVPCVPCQQKKGVRQFSLNAPDVPPVVDDFVPILNDQMTFTALDGQVVLHDPQRDVSHVLNAGAALVWATVDDRLRTIDLVEQLAVETGEPHETIDRDVRLVLAQFLNSGIVLAEPPAGPVHDLSALEHEAALLAREARRGAAHARLALVLEHRDWCSGIGPRQAGGTTVLVRTNDPTIQGHLDEVLSSLPAADQVEATISVVDRGRDGGHRYRVIVDNEVRFRVHTAEEATDHVLTQLNLLAIGRTPHKLLFHGGAVERDGFVVAVLGPSGQGKSTLTAALVQRGWGYLSDELVTVDPATLRVEPYPKALDLSDQSLELLGPVDALPPLPPGKRQVPPASLGSLSTGGRLGLLVMLGADDAGGHDVSERAGGSPLAPIDALQQLMLNTFRETMQLPDALDHLARLCTVVPAVALERSDLERSCSQIVHAVQAHALGPASQHIGH